MLCCPIRSLFRASSRLLGRAKRSRNVVATCRASNRRRAADSMLTKRATRSLWNSGNKDGEIGIGASVQWQGDRLCPLHGLAAIAGVGFKRRGGTGHRNGIGGGSNE